MRANCICAYLLKQSRHRVDFLEQWRPLRYDGKGRKSGQCGEQEIHNATLRNVSHSELIGYQRSPDRRDNRSVSAVLP